MKKVLSYAAALVAMFATSACSNKELTPTPDEQGAVVSIRISSTSAGETKTGVVYDAENKKHSPYWNAGDQIGVFFDGFESKTKADAVLTNTSADKASEASFSAENITLNNGTVPGAEGRIFSFYPASAFNADGVVAADQAVRANLKTVQTPAAVDTYDPSADILVGQPSGYLYDEGYLYADVAFARAMSIVKVTLKAGNECPANLAVNSFTMTAPEGTILTGRAKLSLAALYDKASPIMEWTVPNNTVTANYNEDFHPVIGGAENTVYVIVNPTSIASGNIVFNIDTDNYTIEKTVPLSNALAFPQSNVANIGLTISGTNCTPKVAETRIFVENFSGVTTSATRVQPSGTGAKGTGLNQNTAYDFGSDNNTNIRFNSNGHSTSDPYLYLRANATFTISNISVSEVSSLQFKAQTKNAGSVELKYKESSSENWNTVDTWTTAASFGEQSSVFAISNSATSLDFSFTAGSAAVIIDDIVIDRYVDRHVKLGTPENLVAEIDENVPNKVNISWDAVENASAYEVVLSADGQDEISKTPENNELVVANLSYNTTYSVKVRATTTDTENYYDSEFSTPIEITTGQKPAGSSSFVLVEEEPDSWEGDYLIVYNNTYAMNTHSGNQNANTYATYTDISSYYNITEKSFEANDVTEALVYKAEETTNGYFLYCVSDESYLGITANTTSTGAKLRWNTSYSESECDWILGVGSVKNVGSNTLYIRWNNNSGSERFAAYGSTGQQAITLFKRDQEGTKKYSVICSPVDGGTLTANPAKATEGATVTLSAEANEGWQFNNDWSVDNGNVTVTEGTFTMPARNVNVTGSFSKKNLAISKAAATNGSFDVKVNSSVVSTAQVGDEVTLVANPDPNYELKSWTVYKTGDESTKVTVTNNAFTMPAYPVTVKAEFTEAGSGPVKTYEVTGTLASWTFESGTAGTNYPANKTNFANNGSSDLATGTFYLDGTGSTWNSSKGYAFTAVTSVTITVKAAKDLKKGAKITFSMDTYYNKASNAPMTGFNLTAAEGSATASTTGLSVISFSLSTSSANKSVVYTLQNDVAKDGTVKLVLTQTGKAGAGQGFINNVKADYAAE